MRGGNESEVEVLLLNLLIEAVYRIISVMD